MRVNAERKDRGKKLMQVLLIRTAEKTERKKIKERGLQTEKKNNPLQRRFSGFVFFKLSFCGQKECLCVCVSKVCVYASCIINASCI